MRRFQDGVTVEIEIYEPSEIAEIGTYQKSDSKFSFGGGSLGIFQLLTLYLFLQLGFLKSRVLMRTLRATVVAS